MWNYMYLKVHFKDTYVCIYACMYVSLFLFLTFYFIVYFLLSILCITILLSWLLWWRNVPVCGTSKGNSDSEISSLIVFNLPQQTKQTLCFHDWKKKNNSYSFTLFICGGPCLKQCEGSLFIHLLEKIHISKFVLWPNLLIKTGTMQFCRKKFKLKIVIFTILMR